MKLYLQFILILLIPFLNHSQNSDFTAAPVITNHEVNINGSKIEYTAEAGFQEIFDSKDEAVGALFYTYYQRKANQKKEAENRPLVISFNGGPGSASVWMHIAYTGPRVLKIDEEGFPVQPYGIEENPYSILDVADIVYVNPVNTGYSRGYKDEKGNIKKELFFGVQEDVSYLAKWISQFVSQKNRWLSPKYLIGESYGTTRVSGLAYQLQNSHWMYLNGVILVSPTELGIDRNGPVEIANRIPYFTAAAWYHEKLPRPFQNMELEEILEISENYAINKLTPVLVKGNSITEEEKMEVCQSLEELTGINARVYQQHNLELPYNYFWKELLRDEGFTIGRLDSRYKGIDEKDAGERPEYNAELSSWLHSFTPAINHYLKNDLKVETPAEYLMFGNVYPWDRTKNNSTGKLLRRAMTQNPNLKVLIQSGYFDGATTYFNAKYNMWHIDESGKMKDRFEFKAYKSGHMMYLRREDLKKSNDDVRYFILKSMEEANKSSAKY